MKRAGDPRGLGTVFGNLLTLALLVCPSFATHTGFILKGVYFPVNNPTRNAGPLREGGNVMSPPYRGINIIKCGALLNNDPNFFDDTRLVIAKGQPFKVEGMIFDGVPGASILFSIIYGANPDFTGTDGFVMVEPNYNVPSASVTSFVLTRTIDVAYNYAATLQVEYRTGNMSFFQCIDLNVTGGLPWPGGNQIDPTVVNDTGVFVRNTIFVNDSGLSPFQILLIILCILLLLIVCCLLCLIRYHRNKNQEMLEKSGDAKFAGDPERAAGIPVEDHNIPRPVEVEDEEEEEEVEEVDEMGTAGRHFHFRYVD